MPAAGRYRHRILIRDAPSDATRDTFGRRKGAGATVCEVWAEKQDWQGSETTQSGREVASMSTKWKIRHRTDVTPEMEIVLDSDVYRITSVLDFDGRKRELVLTSEQVLA
jgi:SPP1 family predicted phage head-tail adaptor